MIIQSTAHINKNILLVKVSSFSFHTVILKFISGSGVIMKPGFINQPFHYSFLFEARIESVRGFSGVHLFLRRRKKQLITGAINIARYTSVIHG